MNHYRSCQQCVYRDRKHPNVCKYCVSNETTGPRFELGKVDIFKLAAGLKTRQEQQGRRKATAEAHDIERRREVLKMCAQCGEISLWRNSVEERYECLNTRCGRRDIFANVIWPAPGSASRQDEYAEPGLRNPLLLSVKMFLADIRSWRAQYRAGEYVCADFARDVYNAATSKSIRCGYVVISFAKSQVRHAIVAFETDCGLRFFEPQDGNEVDVVIGRRYSSQAEGSLGSDNVKVVEISWNDRTSTRID